MLGEKLLSLRKKQGYSQQDVADLISVTRQTISNWESDQGVPTIDKAKMLANLYHISLDDMLENEIEVMTPKKAPKDLHLLQYLIGKTCILECQDTSFLFDIDYNSKVRVIDVNDDWIKVEYHIFFKREKVIKLIDMSVIQGIEIMEDKS